MPSDSALKETRADSGNVRTFLYFDNVNVSKSSDCRVAYKKIKESSLYAYCSESQPKLNSIDFLEESRTIDYAQSYRDHYKYQDVNASEKFYAASIVQSAQRLKDLESTNSLCLSEMPKNASVSYSNLAITLKYLINVKKFNKILLINFSPNSDKVIQRTFYNDPRLLNLSIHSKNYDTLEWIGTGKGSGYNINIPVDHCIFNEADLMCLLHRIVMPIAYEYNPDLVIFTPGFKSDNESFSIEPEIYEYATRYFMALAKGRLLTVMCDHYGTETFSPFINNILSSMTNCSLPLIHHIDLTNIHTETFELVKNLTAYLRLMWKHVSICENSGLLPYPSITRYDSSPTSCNATLAKESPEMDKPTVKEDELIDGLSKIRIERDQGNSTSSKVSIIYDEFLERHSDPEFPDHPESPMRTKIMWDYLGREDLLSRCDILKNSRFVTRHELLAVHTPELIDSLERFGDEKNFNAQEAIKFSNTLDSIFINKDSIRCAKMASGNLLNLVDDICQGNNKFGVAVIRPPGHHAEKNRSMGFCFYNNIGVAVRYAQKKYSLNRVLVLDWDVHHGNGTQDIFKEDQDVLYISMHRYDHGKFYPSDPEGDFSQTYQGSNVNVAWNGKAVNDAEYIAALFHIILPVIIEFKPEMTFISAGFDGCRFDPLGGLRLSTELFGHFAHFISVTSQMYQMKTNSLQKRPGSVILALEGGYHLTMIAKAMSHCIRALLGDSLKPPSNETPISMRNCRSIMDAIRVNQEYWKILKGYESTPTYCHEDLYLKDLKKLRLIEEAKNNPRQLRSGDNTPSNVSRKDDSFFSQDASLCTMNSIISDRSGKEEPIILELLQQEEIEAMSCFAVQPKPTCPHMDRYVDPAENLEINPDAPCLTCNSTQENWICLTCYKTYCGRHVEKHMVDHYNSENHPLTLSYTDFSVWCYPCESYINDNKTKKAIDLMTKAKFPTN